MAQTNLRCGYECVEETRTLRVAELTAKGGMDLARAVEFWILSEPPVAVTSSNSSIRRLRRTSLRIDEERRNAIIAAAPAPNGEQWSRNRSYEEGSWPAHGAALAVFPPGMTIAEAIAQVRDWHRKSRHLRVRQGS